MALFRVSLRQGHGGTTATYKWSNIFYVNMPDALSAALWGVSLWGSYLRFAAKTQVWCYQTYATDLVPGTDNFAVASPDPEFQRGTIVQDISDEYHPNIALAVTLVVPSSRPSRKFWRPGLQEVDIINGTAVEAGLVSTIGSQFAQAILNLDPPMLDPDSQQISNLGTIKLTTRRLGREAFSELPTPPPLG